MIRAHKAALTALTVLACMTAGPMMASSGEEERNRVALSQFLERKHRQHDQFHSALVSRGKLRDFELARELVQHSSVRLPPGDRAPDAAQREKLRAHFKTDLAQLLPALGWTAEGIAAQQTLGSDPIVAAGEIVRGTGSFADFSLLADTVVLARATGREDAHSPDDGFLSSSTFVVTESLKGEARKGEKVFLRQSSGRDKDGREVRDTSDFTAKPGQLYLLLLSHNWYQHRLAAEGMKAVPGARKYAMLYGGAYEVDKDALRAVRSFDPMPPTLQNVRLTTRLKSVR